MAAKQAAAVKIGPAKLTHLAQIPSIELAAASIFTESDLPRHIRYKVTDPVALQHALDNKRIWTATNGRGQVVGFAMADIVDGAAHLDEMNVLPDYGRRGIGTRLVRSVKEWAQSSGFRGLTLITFRHLPWNAPFYGKLGFVTLNHAELGDGLTSLMDDEASVGINMQNRVCMKLQLDSLNDNKGIPE